MTSQVSLINHSGMALASDTITTVGGTKTLTTNSKIYEIGEAHKVVVLHNGSVNINGVSAKLHVAEWSLQLNKPLAQVQDYLSSFTEWFDSSRAIYGKESSETLIYEAIWDYFEWISNHVKSMSSAGLDPALPQDELEKAGAKVVSEAIDSRIAASKKWVSFDGLSDQAGQELITATSGVDLNAMIGSLFSDINLSAADKRKLKSAAPLGITRRSRLNTDCELVFAGFGASEPFGNLVRIIIRGAYGGKLRWHIAGTDSVNATHPISSLNTFAQDDAIHGFLRGWTSVIREQVSETVFDTTWNSLVEAELPIELDSIQSISDAVHERVLRDLDETSLNQFAYPLMNTVGAMSLINLSQLADSLIGIQAASTYSKAGAATVGGFIEVITIDRLNGVKWHKKLGEKF